MHYKKVLGKTLAFSVRLAGLHCIIEGEVVKNNEMNEISSEDFMDMFKKIDNCNDVDVIDISYWLKVDNDGRYVTLTDEEVIASCSPKETN